MTEFKHSSEKNPEESKKGGIDFVFKISGEMKLKEILGRYLVLVKDLKKFLKILIKDLEIFSEKFHWQ